MLSGCLAGWDGKKHVAKGAGTLGADKLHIFGLRRFPAFDAFRQFLLATGRQR